MKCNVFKRSDNLHLAKSQRPGCFEELEKNAVRKCQEGNITGLETLYTLYGEKVFRTCYRILGDHASAEDETQEVFIRLFGKIRTFQGHSSFSTWLYRLAVNHALNSLRNRQRQPTEVEKVEILDTRASDNPWPDHSLLLKEKRDFVQELLAALPNEQRTAIVLREIEGLSYAEIAEVTGVPTGTVMSRLYRARQGLKRYYYWGIVRPAFVSKRKK